MHYPLIDRQLLSALRLVHAGYNSLVAAAFFYHGWLGMTIRRARMAHAPLPFPVIKRHRKTGPIIAALGCIGFLIGCTLVLLDKGNILEYPPHFIVGLLIVLLISTTVIISRKIKGPVSPYRNPHYLIGLMILCLYAIEIALGLGVLL
jgi:Protein of unknown function (DUF4079)